MVQLMTVGHFLTVLTAETLCFGGFLFVGTPFAL